MSFEGGNPPGWHNVTPAAPWSHYNPPPPIWYSPGPSRRASMSGHVQGSAPPPAPPPDIFAGHPGPAVDAASQIARQFTLLMGFPGGVDVNQLALGILNMNLEGDTSRAMSWLYFNGRGITDDLRRAHIGAQFGIDDSAFAQRKTQIDSLFMTVTGQDTYDFFVPGSDLQQLYRQAFRESWSQSQLLQTLQSDPRFTRLRQDQPWLVAGQGYQQVSQTFSSVYGSAPVDTATLAAWFRFNTGTAQLSRTGREAAVTAAPMASTAETR